MARTRAVIWWLAGGLMVAGVVVALLLPTYTCQWGSLEEFTIGGEPTEVVCIQSDLGYRPRSWLPTKVAVALGGFVAAGALLLASRRRWFAAIALGLLFVAATLGWFLPNGFHQPVRDGQPVCCGRAVDRSAVRASIAVVGLMLATAFVATDVVRHRSRHRRSVG